MSKHDQAPQISTRSLALRLLALAVGMFAFGFLLVPLYDVFCEITGFGGRTNETAATNVVAVADTSREIQLEFVTTVNQYAPWEFAAASAGMTIHPGGMYEAEFIATNLTNQHKIAQAVPSVAPLQAASYFKKLECFCFSNQAFEPGERKSMPVRFVIDSDLPEYIDTITLSYTFFDTARPGDEPLDAEHPGHTSR
ncbi:MAG: cytochrome c oxidase assembly protein [Woeseiaceae bacterium]